MNELDRGGFVTASTPMVRCERLRELGEASPFGPHPVTRRGRWSSTLRPARRVTEGFSRDEIQEAHRLPSLASYAPRFSWERVHSLTMPRLPRGSCWGPCSTN